MFYLSASRKAGYETTAKSYDLFFCNDTVYIYNMSFSDVICICIWNPIVCKRKFILELLN